MYDRSHSGFGCASASIRRARGQYMMDVDGHAPEHDGDGGARCQYMMDVRNFASLAESSRFRTDAMSTSANSR